MTTKKKTDEEVEKPDPKPDPKPDTVETNPVEPREPYPTGKGRDPEADFEAAHGYRRDQKKEG